MVSAVAIDHVVRALGNAPRHAALFAVPDLPHHGHPAGFVEQCVGIAPHHEERHQVLEERRAPGEQRRHARHARDRPAEPEPVRLGDIALRDGDEARQPRFRSEQIVVRVIEAAWALGIRRAITHGQQTSRLVVQQAELHPVRKRDRALGEPIETLGRQRIRLDGRRQIASKPIRPVREIRTVPVGQSDVEFRCDGFEARQRLGEPGQLLGGAGAAGQNRSNVLDGQPGRATVEHIGRRCAVRVVDGALQERGDFFEPLQIDAGFGPDHELAQAGRYRQQRRGEIATVDRRHIVRPERRQIHRVVPVEQVTFEPFHSLDR